MNPTTPQNSIPTTPKSATAAGLLGIFLGGVGAHNWYLGQKTKGIIHVCIFGGGFLLMLISSCIMSAASLRLAFALSTIFWILDVIAYLALLGNSIWGLVEGIIILSKGDAGLAAQGYTVAAPVIYQQPAQPAAPTAPAAPVAPASEAKPAETAETTDKPSEAKSEKSPEKDSKAEA